MMFYGMESQLIPVSEVMALRSRASKAILGHSSCASPFLLLSLLSPCDIEVYLLSQALRAGGQMARAFPNLASNWLQDTATFQDKGSRVVGPAGTLAGMLARNGWCLHLDGTCKGPGHWQLHLPTATSREVCALPDAPHTSLRPSHALSAAGGFLSQAARSSFDPTMVPACTLCGEPDTKAHRIYHCRAVSHVRAPFQQALHWVAMHAPHWVHSLSPSEHSQGSFPAAPSSLTASHPSS